MKPYTEVYDRWSFLDPNLPNPAVGGYPGAIVFAGDGPNSCHCRTPIKTYYGAIGPRVGLAYSLNDRTVAAGGLRHQLLPPRRRRWPRRRAQRHRHARLLGQRELPERRTASIPPTTGTTACRRIRLRRSSIRPSTPASSPAAGTGGGVTYGDPEIGGRPPRYQNWNAGFQYALARTLTVGATYAGSRGDFLGGSGRGLLLESARSALPRPRQPADAAGDGRQHRRRAGDRAGRRPAVCRISRAPSRRCCGRSRSTPA